ncbi:MAG: fluoride efflux transporter CrcB [Pseudonocardiaceae bacterium]|nr:fluoride efflux transporter CrcB [Pseudonocardiaceae bacterium]
MTGAGQRTDVLHARRTAPRARQWDVVLAVAAGGALGSIARYGLSLVVPHEPGQFPVATLLANIGGCLAIGVLMAVITEATAPHRLLRPFLGIGFLGGFTTLSTYVVETIDSVRTGHPVMAVSYLLGTVVACLLSVVLGLLVTRSALTRGRSAVGRR